MTDLSKPRKPIHWRRIIALIIVAIILLWIGLLVRDALVLRADVLALQDYFATLPQPIKLEKIDVPFVQQRVTSIHENLSALRSHAAPLLAIAPAFGWIPNIGGDIQAAPALMDMALQFTDIGDKALKAMVPFWPPPSSNGHPLLPTMTRILQWVQPDMQSFRANIDRAGEIRQQLDAAKLSPRLRSIIDKFDAAYPIMSAGVSLLAVAPQLLGADRPRTYLILFQNEDELRPSGGFISAAGRITIDAGKIATMTVMDGNVVDDFTKPYGDPPEPLLKYMGSELWLFRDSNWSPDFPTAAHQAAELYQYGQNVDAIDGVIALDKPVVKTIVAAIEPLTVNAAAPPITSGNIDDYMRAAWAPSTNAETDPQWALHRKDFIGQIAQVMLQRLLDSPGDVRWVDLARGLLDRFERKDLLITLNDPTTETTFATLNWNGAVKSMPGDYLMIVDSNLGFNKVNPMIAQTVAYSIALQPDSLLTADLDVIYRNLNPAQPGCEHQPDYGPDLTYALLINRCYWDYRRVLAPADAQLQSASQQPVSADYLVTHIATDGSSEVSHELSKTVFSTLFVVERGQTQHVNLSYSLPSSIIAREDHLVVYRLLVQKQPGAAAWPVTITISWPDGYTFATAQPVPESVADRSITIPLTLDRDQQIEVRLNAPR